MKAFLMHKDQDFDLDRPLPANEQDLIQDLEINTLINAMALGDKFLFEVGKKAVLTGLGDIDTINYRQNVLKDCLKNPAIVRKIYQIPIESDNNKHKHWLGILTHYPSGMLSSSVEMMQMFVGLLKKLKLVADEHSDKFESEGFKTFFSMIKRELDDEYFSVVENHLKELKFYSGVLISAKLGEGNEGTDYILRAPNNRNGNWIKELFSRKLPSYSFYIDPRDDAGMQALSSLRDRGINLVANALAQSADHIDAFFNMLRVELAFYIGCLNLYDQLAQMKNPVSFPVPVPAIERRLSFRGLYDVSLALTKKHKIVGNDTNADNKDLVFITGANQGGKSTFLRSIGQAQLLMQCGMFVPAESFSAALCEGLFTHYRREEDSSMKSGKLDEELVRMSTIVDNIKPNSIVLFNESFSTTNEREGSEIARQITSALLERHIKIFFVTHQYEFAHGFYIHRMENILFLRAERKEGGGRTFKLIEGEPLQTSFGEDVYWEIFGLSKQNSFS